MSISDGKIEKEKLSINCDYLSIEFTTKSIMADQQESITIDVYSDLACPWCYVGKRHLNNALHKYTTDNPGASVTVLWHPYIIDKNTAKHGENYKDYNIRRWGGDGWTHSLRKSGRKIGLEFKNWKTWPNTVHAHQLILLAGEQKGPAGQDAAKNLLFHMIYEEGRNISDIDTLIEAAHQLQLDSAEEYLKSNKGNNVILSEDAKAKNDLGITGVPFFILKGKQGSHTLSGAQPSENILKAMYELKQ